MYQAFFLMPPVGVRQMETQSWCYTDHWNVFFNFFDQCLFANTTVYVCISFGGEGLIALYSEHDKIQPCHYFYSGCTQCLEVNVNIGTLLTVQIKTRWCYAGIMCSLLKTVKYFMMLTLLTRTEHKVHLRLIYPSSYQEGDVNVYVLISPWNHCEEHKNS